MHSFQPVLEALLEERLLNVDAAIASLTLDEAPAPLREMAHALLHQDPPPSLEQKRRFVTAVIEQGALAHEYAFVREHLLARCIVKHPSSSSFDGSDAKDDDLDRPTRTSPENDIPSHDDAPPTVSWKPARSSTPVEAAPQTDPVIMIPLPPPREPSSMKTETEEQKNSSTFTRGVVGFCAGGLLLVAMYNTSPPETPAEGPVALHLIDVPAHAPVSPPSTAVLALAPPEETLPDLPVTTSATALAAPTIVAPVTTEELLPVTVEELAEAATALPQILQEVDNRLHDVSGEQIRQTQEDMRQGTAPQNHDALRLIILDHLFRTYPNRFPDTIKTRSLGDLIRTACSELRVAEPDFVRALSCP